jgi:hypothetical protein
VLTPAMWQVLRYTAEHGCAAKIGGPWLEVARLLEREGFLELRDCLGGYCAARLTPAGAEALQTRMWCALDFRHQMKRRQRPSNTGRGSN